MSPETVLMTLMGLGIGGAETHAVVLARDLRELGFNVLMASKGGIYEDAVRNYGIRHFTVPLDNTGISSILHSVRAVRSIINREKVSLIHAHARIPAFVSSLARNPAGARFITTAHALFSTDFRFRYLSRWGEKTIAVSPDIKEHLVRRFGVSEENIILIPNGIDTDTFHPSIKHENIPGELGFGPGDRKIIYVSRLDRAIAPVALELIRACEKLHAEFSDLKLVITGDGERSGEVGAEAGKAIARAGRGFIRMLGARTDVNRIMAAGDLVVGASRVALEAMACARNVVLAGGEGFRGLIREENLLLNEKDNFTGRLSGGKVTALKLEQSIREFFAAPPEKNKQAGLTLRKYIVEKHSSKTVARETAGVYRSVLAGEKK